jgi:hypothetical protein
VVAYLRSGEAPEPVKARRSVTTRDPEVVEAALRRLPEAQPETVITFDGDQLELAAPGLTA